MSWTPSLPMSPQPKSYHQRQMPGSRFDRYGTIGAGPTQRSKSSCGGGCDGFVLPIDRRRWLFQALATSTSPIAPPRTRSMASWTTAVLRLCVPTWRCLPERATASAISRPSRMLWQHGFST